MLVLAESLHMGPPGWAPPWIAMAKASLATKNPRGEELVRLLETVPPEFRALERVSVADCANIGARSLLLYGDASPPNLSEAIHALAGVIPGAKLASLAGQGHNAPDLTGVALVADELRAFFSR
jgi:hypothetical protein